MTEHDHDHDVTSIFEAAADYLAGLASREDESLTSTSLLQFYGLYKQATAGDCQGDKPSIFNPSKRAKWAAWKQVEGMDRATAQQQYVALLQQVQPQWSPAAAAGSQPAMGPVFSSLQAAASNDDDQIDAAALPLHAAASSGAEARVQQLLGRGADVNCRDDEGCSPLHWAADKGHAQVIHALLLHGADVNAQDHDGLTPLHYAALAEQSKAAEVLLQSGADASMENAEGETAKDVAPPSWQFLVKTTASAPRSLPRTCR